MASEERLTNSLFYFDKWEGYRFIKDGKFECPTVSCVDGEEIPDCIVENAPCGWSKFVGSVKILTKEDLEEDKKNDFDDIKYPDGEVGMEWWTGKLVPATAEEVISFFEMKNDV